MRTRIITVAAALLLVASAGALVAPLAAQSLAEIAKKEEERRKAIKQPAKVLTNKDLKPVPAPEPAQAVSQSDAPTNATADTSKDGAKDATKDASKDVPAKDAGSAAGAAPAVKDQAYWSGELRNRQSQLSRDQIYAAALQSRVNALGTDFVNRDDPAQRAVIAGDRQRALDELDHLNKQIVTDQQAITDFMEEARRAGVPPGWLR
jgi:hypothetical protein